MEVYNDQSFSFSKHNFCLILCGVEAAQCFCNPVPHLGFSELNLWQP